MDAATKFAELSKVPSTDEAFDEWLRANDALRFLEADIADGQVVIDAVFAHSLVHGVLVPISKVELLDAEDILAWQCDASSSWGVSCTLSDPAEVTICPPLDMTGSSTLDHGDQLVFARFFERRRGRKTYRELSQRLTHVLDLHFVRERNAYCRIDPLGEIDQVIRIVEFGTDEFAGGTVVTIDRNALDRYMLLTGTAMVRTFDFTRYRPARFGDWHEFVDPPVQGATDLFYQHHCEAGNASHTRGFQIVRPRITMEEMVQYCRSYGQPAARQYESFVVHDCRHRTVQEVSCAPGQTATYFSKSDLPYELSPAFFRPDVLTRYKSDTEKYRLDERSIICHGAWSLRSYDINEAGQVHAYLVDLRGLPPEEQRHWKAYNELPKGPISARSFTTDFKGEFDVSYDAVSSLKALMRHLHDLKTPWWRLPSAAAIDAVHEPVTTSADEWLEALLRLDQCLVEGFNTKWLKKRAEQLRVVVNPKWASLKVLEACLRGLHVEDDRAHRLVSSLAELHGLRDLKAHMAEERATAAKEEAIAAHGSFRQHFGALCGRCDESVREILELLGSGSSDLPNS